MPIIEMSEESHKFVKELVEKLEKQDNRMTAKPILYLIMETFKEYCEDGDHSEYWKDGGCYNEEEMVEDVKEYLNENDFQSVNHVFETEEEVEGISVEFAKEIALEEMCHEERCYNNAKRFAVGYPNVFFTEEAASRFLKENSYHFNEGCDCVIHAWRNPEMVNVIKALYEIAGVSSK